MIDWNFSSFWWTLYFYVPWKRSCVKKRGTNQSREKSSHFPKVVGFDLGHLAETQLAIAWSTFFLSAWVSVSPFRLQVHKIHANRLFMDSICNRRPWKTCNMPYHVFIHLAALAQRVKYGRFITGKNWNWQCAKLFNNPMDNMYVCVKLWWQLEPRFVFSVRKFTALSVVHAKGHSRFDGVTCRGRFQPQPRPVEDR